MPLRGSLRGDDRGWDVRGCDHAHETYPDMNDREAVQVSKGWPSLSSAIFQNVVIKSINDAAMD